MNRVFSRNFNGEEQRPTGSALTSTAKNDTKGPASNGVSRQCERSQRNGEGIILLRKETDSGEGQNTLKDRGLWRGQKAILKIHFQIITLWECAGRG